MYGVVEAGIAAVLKVTGPKLLGLPFKTMPETVTPLMVIDTVPVIMGMPLTRPLRLMVGVP